MFFFIFFPLFIFFYFFIFLVMTVLSNGHKMTQWNFMIQLSSQH